MEKQLSHFINYMFSLQWQKYYTKINLFTLFKTIFNIKIDISLL